jgi:hypothetical protein
MKAIMEHPLQVLRHLPKKYKTRDGRPPGKEVLQAVLQIDQVDNLVKERIRTVLDLSPKLEEAQAALPESVRQSVESLRQQLTNKTVRDKRHLLRDSGQRSQHREDGLADAMEAAARILEDGEDSIYSPDHSFYRLLQEGRGAARVGAGDVADADAIGAAIGGVAGAIFDIANGFPPGTGPGTVLGPIAGGALASAATAASAVIEFILEPIELPPFD